MKFAPKLLSVLLMTQCSLVFAAGNVDTIFYGGDIVTMNKAQPAAEAVAIQGGRIVKVGSLTQVKSLQGKDTKLINLYLRDCAASHKKLNLSWK